MEGLSPFQTFIALIKFDQETLATHQKLEKLNKIIQEQEIKQKDLLSSLEKAKSTLHNFQKEVHLQELRMKELSEKEKSKKKLLDDTSNQKEYSALKREIDSLKRLQHNFEKELVDSWNKLETAKKEHENIEKDLDLKISEINSTIEKATKDLKETKQLIEQYNKDRLDKEKGVPDEWLQKYNVMHLQVTNPVVPLVGQSCSACFQELTKQDFLDINKNKMMQCKGCFRLLYIE
jgi:uncharacterized protein